MCKDRELLPRRRQLPDYREDVEKARGTLFIVPKSCCWSCERVPSVVASKQWVNLSLPQPIAVALPTPRAQKLAVEDETIILQLVDKIFGSQRSVVVGVIRGRVEVGESSRISTWCCGAVD